MNNLINWFEIPVSDIQRAIRFYSAVLNISIAEAEFFGSKMGFFPSDGTNVSGALVQGEYYIPSQSGVLAYLHGGDDLQPVLERVEKHGGTLMVPKTHIGAEMGYFAIFADTEGNKMALHSKF